MSENEKTLREGIERLWWNPNAITHDTTRSALDALLAEHRAEVERLEAVAAERFRLAEQQEGRAARAEARADAARNAALEEVARMADEPCDPDALADRIRALKSHPGERHIPESEVRRVLRTADADVHADAPIEYIAGWESALAAVYNGLGIDLDAEVAKASCGRCKHGAHEGQTCAADGVWSTPSCLCMGDHDGAPPLETASEENGLLPKKGDSARPRCIACGHAILDHSTRHGGCGVVTNDPERGDRCPCGWLP